MKKNDKVDETKLDRFSFGCYCLQIIWALFNKCWEFIGLSFAVYILLFIVNFPKPLGAIIANAVYFIFSFYALKFSFKRQTKDIDSFLQDQKKWEIAGSIIFIILISYYMVLIYR